MQIKPAFDFLKETFTEWTDDEVPQHAAALAYYTIFSLAPLLLIVIAIAGLAFGRDAVEGRLVGEISGLVGPQGGQAIQTMVANAGRHGSGLLATVVGVVTILFGAMGVFTQLQGSLDHIWDVRPKPGRGIKGIVMSRAAAFGMLLGIGFLLLVSLVVSTALTTVGTYFAGLLPAGKVLLQVVSELFSFAVVTALFAMLFRFLPDVRIAWRDVWVGAVSTALLFTLGKYLIGLYLGRSSVASVYGAAGSLVIVLLWIYYSAMILFFGAEITQVYARRYGTRIQPDKHAMPVPGREHGEKKKEGAGAPSKVQEPQPVSSR
ncbi:MAG TPA: YihY/virulence factor BrkB family protein [Solirubrobacterales bacterium]|nr:YihY/virulence factor BrkB family protein [Solirubrobacterales bacterium]